MDDTCLTMPKTKINLLGNDNQKLPISQRRDHKPPGVADVLVRVHRTGVGLPDVAVFSLAVPVELQLGEPFESAHVHTAYTRAYF